MAQRVLVVDDEKLIVKGIRFSLEQDGMEVDCAYDGEEALKLAEENAYDMVLLDVMLPDGDGFALFEQIRRIPAICLPVNIEIMAGGASLAPRRCAFVADDMEALSSPL